MLPPLLFAAGEELPWRELRSVWRSVTVLSIGLVAVSAAAVAFVTIALTPLPFGMAFVLGAVLASTDPVAVTALGRRLALPPRIQALVQAESLFNDATSLLLFRVALTGAVVAGSVTWATTVRYLRPARRRRRHRREPGGGGRLPDPAADHGSGAGNRRLPGHPLPRLRRGRVGPASGVTAVVVAGVILGTQARKLTTARIRLQLNAVFQTVVFVLESVIFGLIGLQLPELVNRLAGTQPHWPLQALAIAATLVAVRILWIFPLSALSRHDSDSKLSWQAPAVVSWAGARGVVPLAAALSIPLAEGASA